MAESKKFYWIKLKTDFFDTDAIDWLRDQKNGCEYIVLYMMLCTMSANSNGWLKREIGEMIVPWDARKIAERTRFDIDTVIVAIELYKKLGLVFVEENGMLKIVGVENMVGVESEWAQKKREYRNKHKELPSTKEVPDIVPDNSRTLSDKSIEIEFRDKSLEIDSEKDNNSSIPDGMDKRKPSIPQPKITLSTKERERIFAELWEIYPRKQGKANAFKAFEKAIKDGESVERIKNGLIAAVNHWKVTKTDAQFIPMGSTWFNQRRWLDDLTDQQGQGKKELGARFRIDIMG